MILINLFDGSESESNEENDTKASPGKKWQGYFSSDIQVDDETNEVRRQI